MIVTREGQTPLREISLPIVRVLAGEVHLAKELREQLPNIYVLVRCLSDDELHEVEQLRSPGRISSVDNDIVDFPVKTM